MLVFSSVVRCRQHAGPGASGGQSDDVHLAGVTSAAEDLSDRVELGSNGGFGGAVRLELLRVGPTRPVAAGPDLFDEVARGQLLGPALSTWGELGHEPVLGEDLLREAHLQRDPLEVLPELEEVVYRVWAS